MVARVTGTGHLPRADDPSWFLVNEPTAAQVADAIAVADHKVHGGMNAGSYRAISGYAPHIRPGWNWWLKLNKPVDWIHDRTPNLHADEFNPDEGRQIVAGKDLHTLPGRWERIAMAEQGDRALHKFIDGMDATNSERAAYIVNISAVIHAVAYGDLPAAIQIALHTGLPDFHRNRLVRLLEDEMVWWPDFQRADSTSKERTIAHWVPTRPNTSITISATEGGITIGG